MVWDRDTDTVYVSRTYCLREATAIIHAAALKPWGNLPWAWPRDGRRETLEGAGVALAQQYTAQGLDMLWTHAQFEDGSVSVEAGIATCWEQGLEATRHHEPARQAVLCGIRQLDARQVAATSMVALRQLTTHKIEL